VIAARSAILLIAPVRIENGTCVGFITESAAY
jgi:hypothetical protein